jgi:FKBP-type peptidyl-prolyl cis-trans isomerase
MVASSKEITQVVPEGAWGPPAIGNEATAHYTGRVAADGSQFDSSVDRGAFNFAEAGSRATDDGFASMKVGEKACSKSHQNMVTVPLTSPKIPGNATLHFDVEPL